MPQTESQSSYGLVVGFIYIFNLIVGTGALTMPKAFENSGIILSAALLVFLTFMSFITATFMFEAMSITNAIKKLQKLQSEETRGQNANANSYANPNFASEESERSTIVSRETTVDVSKSINDALGGVVEDDNDTSEQRPLIDSSSSSNKPLNSSRTPLPASLAPRPLQQFYYRRILSRADGDLGPVSDPASIDYLFNINYKFEMGEMAGIYFSRIGKLFFYLAMILYLYGDLAIYDAAVPKSLRDTTCTYKSENTTVSPTDEDICWPSIPGLTRLNAYRIYVLLFNMTIGVLVFYNVQKTKLLQMLTTVMRWAAFIAMIALAVKKIHENSQDPSQKVRIKLADIESVPNFFGVCIYAFMCHHSLPSIITPMRRKENYKRIFITTYSCIMVFYLLLSSTAVFAFGNKLDDFYTLNFAPSTYDKSRDSVFILIVDYYLALFPVFTISASFPIIGITLRNNLKSLYYFIRNLEDDLPGQPLPSNQKSYFISLALPLITLTPPLIISLITHDLQLLVGFTGSYAGVAIQYVIPSCLVYFGRKEAVRVFRENFQLKHSYASPFKSKFWVFFVLLWANISIIFVTIDHIIKFYNN